MDLDRRHVGGRRELGVLEAVGQLLGVLVVDELLEEAVRDPLDDAALGLRPGNRCGRQTLLFTPQFQSEIIHSSTERVRVHERS